jgi:hypothetical protein
MTGCLHYVEEGWNMKRKRLFFQPVAFLGSVVLLWGCADETTPTQHNVSQTVRQSSVATAPQRVLIEWGTGQTRVKLDAGGVERTAQGPSAIAVGPQRRVYLLDRLQSRIARIDAEGGLETVATVPADAELLAVGPQGTMAVMSLLRFRVWLFDAAGNACGSLPVPRTIRHLRDLRLTASNRVEVHTALQETFLLGSPNARFSLPAVLAAKREGAAFLADGRGVQVRLDAPGNGTGHGTGHGAGHGAGYGTGHGAGYGTGHGAVYTIAPAGRSRQRASARMKRVASLQLDAQAVRVVGTSGGRVCLRWERMSHAAKAAVAVDRGLTCLDANDAFRQVFARSLGEPGLYVPRREVALGGDSVARVAWMKPTRTGLVVSSFPLHTPDENGVGSGQDSGR